MTAPRQAAVLLAVVALAYGCATVPSGSDTVVWPPAGVDSPGEVALVGAVTEVRVGGAAGLLRAVAGAVPGGAAAGTLVRPVAVAVADGRLAVVDTARGRVTVSDLDGRHGAVLRLPDGFLPSAVAFEGSARSLVVCDGPSGEVRRFDGSGRDQGSVVPPSAVTRCGGLAWCANGDVLVADTGAGGVLRVDGRGEVVARIGGRGGEEGRFNFPTAVAEAPDGSVWVLDTLNFRVQELDAMLRPVGGFGQLGDGSGQFALPKGLGLDPDGHVYVSDARFDLVQMFDPDGRLLLVIGRPGGDPGEFWSPAGIACDADGTIAIADPGNRRVQILRYRHREESR